jgi:zinc protease
VVLPNGLTLLVQPDPAAPAVAVVSHVCAGFFDEPDRVAGVSHVLEHMLFKGTPTRSVGAIARETKAAGGYLNASTGYTHTTYFAVLPPASLRVALDLQSDALQRSVLDPDELRRELRVIIEEAKRKLDTPAAVAGETLHAVLFDRHRIRRWRIGTEEQLAALSHADVVAYYRSRYLPARVVVAVVGAVEPDLAIQLAREFFEGWPAAEATLDPSPDEPMRTGVRARTLRGDVRRADLVVGWRAVPALHPDAVPLDLAAAVLASGRASWLYRRLREPGIVTAVGAWHFSPPEVGVFSIGADLDSGRLAAALEGAAECTARLRDPGPAPEDIARAQTLLRARWARRLESTEGRAAALAEAEALGGLHLLEEEYDRMLAVDAEAVRRAAAEWLAPDRVAGVAYLPASAPEELNPGMLQDAFARPPEPASPLTEPRAPAIPGAAPARGTVESGVLHVALPAADLLIQRKSGVPLVSVGVYRRRTVHDTLATSGLGALAVRAAVRGAGELDAGGLALAFERLGGALSPVAGADWFGFGTSVLAERAPEAAALLDLVLHAPRFEADAVAKERATLADEAAQAADDMFRYPVLLALRAAFGDTRYGLPGHGLPETIPGLTERMVREWHGAELVSGRATVVLVGELEPERAAEMLAGLFAGRGGSAPKSGSAAVSRSEGPAASVAERAKRQTGLAMLFPGPSRGSPERNAAEVWAAIASGLGGRLFTALREERSLAYTVLASSWQRADAGALLLYLATSPEREAEARDALLEELAGFRDQPPAPDELARAVNYLAGQALVQRQTASAVAGEIADAWLVGGGLAELADPAARFRAVTADQVRDLAARCLDPARRVEGIVRGVGAGAGAGEGGTPAR